MISVQVAEGREAVEALTDEWAPLVDESYTAAFAGPFWYLAWLDASPGGRIAVITAREDNRLVGVLPLARFRTDARGLYLKMVAPIARGDYQPPIVAPDKLKVALAPMLDAAIHHFGRHGVYSWPNIPSLEPSVDLLRSFFASRKMPFTETTEMAPRLRIDGMDFAKVELGWPASHRKDVRRQRKRLSEQGPVSLWVPSTLAEAQPVLDEFFRVHDEKWLSQGYPGMFQDPIQRTFFQAVLRRLWGRGVHFSTVRCGSTDISYQFGFLAGKWLQWYRPSYRSEYHNFSPSKIHVAMIIEEACRLQWKGVDFLLGEEPYKLLWTNETMEVVSIYAGFHQWSPSYFWFTRGKPYTKQHLARAYVNAKTWIQKRRMSTP